jgi:hypothetical protein
MFDPYSELRSNLRAAAFLHPRTQTTWPDMVRQSRNEDIEVRLRRAYSEGFAAGLMSRFLGWQSNLLHRPARQVQIDEQYLPLKRHFPVHR